MHLILTMFTLTLMLKSLSILNTNNLINKEKNSAFESGFSYFSSPRSPFSIQFFKILLLFLMFDIEIILVLPFPLFHHLNSTTMLSCSLIILLILCGLIYEWWEGTLNWV
uniref:NADH-ubiquinone oxidoreductase chain 3 n=1 Tax=Blattisocius tarsalis TaxID=1609195 RepID=A0A6B9WGF9_9ACAR|nr:NADH dehydrogenase subunit 3 [Blattisocius tarsalis]QHQ98566.1 NADH dehydrogenase subunit 3 [Blattisocius tarsalis]